MVSLKLTTKGRLSPNIPISAAFFLNTLGQGGGFIAIPLYLRSLDASFFVVGTVMSTFFIGSIIALIPVGRLSDRWGKRNVIMLGFSLLSIELPIFALIGSPVLMMPVAFFMGMAWAMTIPIGIALLGDMLPPSGRGKGLSRFQGVLWMALATGPLLGGIMIEVFHPRVPLFMWSILAFSALLIVFRFVKKPTPVQKVELDLKSDKQDKGRLIRPGLLLTFAGACAVRAREGLNGGFNTTLLPSYAILLGGSPVITGGLFFVYWSARAISSFLYGPRIDKFGRKPGVYMGTILIIVSTLWFALAPTYVHLFGAMILTGIGIGLLGPSLVSVLIDVSNPKRSGETQSISLTFMNATSLVSAFSLGGIADTFDLQTAAIVVFVFSVIGSLPALVIRETKSLLQQAGPDQKSSG
ncbi:MAG: MFS transporter [Nitrososphaerales archaeon]